MGPNQDAIMKNRINNLNNGEKTTSINGITADINEPEVVTPVSSVENEGTIGVEETIEQLRERIGE